MDSVKTSRPEDWRRGWAENKIREWRKMLAQTEAVSRMMPAWAITAVPIREDV